MSSNHADAAAKVLDASDYYAIFDLDQASELRSEGAKKALRSKWRELSKLTHTDKSHDPRGEDAFKQLQEAYKTLSNDEEREQYDATLARANSRASEIVGNEDAARVAEIKEEIRRLVKSAAKEALHYVRQALEWEGNHKLPMRVTMHFVGACGTADAAEAALESLRGLLVRYEQNARSPERLAAAAAAATAAGRGSASMDEDEDEDLRHASVEEMLAQHEAVAKEAAAMELAAEEAAAKEAASIRARAEQQRAAPEASPVARGLPASAGGAAASVASQRSSSRPSTSRLSGGEGGDGAMAMDMFAEFLAPDEAEASLEAVWDDDAAAERAGRSAASGAGAATSAAPRRARSHGSSGSRKVDEMSLSLDELLARADAAAAAAHAAALKAAKAAKASAAAGSDDDADDDAVTLTYPEDTMTLDELSRASDRAEGYRVQPPLRPPSKARKPIAERKRKRKTAADDSDELLSGDDLDGLALDAAQHGLDRLPQLSGAERRATLTDSDDSDGTASRKKALKRRAQQAKTEAARLAREAAAQMAAARKAADASASTAGAGAPSHGAAHDGAPPTGAPSNKAVKSAPARAATHGSEDEAVEDAEEGEFEVEALLLERAPNRYSTEVTFRVRWKGFDEDEDTWEPESSLPPHLVAQFRERRAHERALAFAAKQAEERVAREMAEAAAARRQEVAAQSAQGTSDASIKEVGRMDSVSTEAAGEAEGGSRKRKASIALDEKNIAKAVRAQLRRAVDPAAVSRKELREALERQLGSDLSEWKEAIKMAAVHFVASLAGA
ncbi:hypothetical protein Ctob_002505 [Chrysochromulina tobinii]|uniref:Chromo domain-containing protein n=1 Tax=Chrysochromulina tobinii TaxID=1460289 RepID=A0A0M0JSK2_9EUKA|nr:hypothetical protein Ctob_002505 [Chrysochromulina tobinii]|eukprot:KOO29168.1 hypothetical protein Ctob_002505 [Chrysochromulina sp. CCMP291]